MKKLPIGISTFSEIIEGNYIYVDKTQQIHEMINTGKTYFLSRPRRFGKSLLVSTLKELFQRNKKLFEGLYIYDKWDWDEEYPVFHLDFGTRAYNTPKQLEISLISFISRIARDFSIELFENSLPSKFNELISEIHKKTGKKLVVLIDEYDKPIIDCIENIEIANKNRDVLSDFYQVLKASDEHLRFIFLTGVSKFSKTTIFSKLNNLADITLNNRYSVICGYTQKELEKYFKDYLVFFSREKNINLNRTLYIIKKWYNGYSWDGKNFLYNPFSVLSFFNEMKVNNHWFDSGTPTFLTKLIKKDDSNTEVLENLSATFSGAFPDFDLNNFDLPTILLQTGYLTIKEEKENIDGLATYKLAIPNKEVEESFYSYLLGVYTNRVPATTYPLAKSMLKYILDADEVKLNKSLETLVSGIPHILHGQMKKNEAYYHILFLTWMKLMGFEIEGEVQTIKGRIDAVLKQKNEVVIIEIKYSENEQIEKMLDDAMEQIQTKEYYKPYQDKNVTLLAIAFKEKEIFCKIKHIGRYNN